MSQGELVALAVLSSFRLPWSHILTVIGLSDAVISYELWHDLEILAVLIRSSESIRTYQGAMSAARLT